MSLVRDALAKAEREAAARAAREKGLPESLAALPPPYRARRRRRWPWVLAAALSVVASAGGLWLLGDRGSTPAPASRTPVDPIEARGAGTLAPDSARAAESVERPVTRDETPAREAPADAPKTLPAARIETPAARMPDAPPATPPPVVAPQPRAAPAAPPVAREASGTASPRAASGSFVRTVDLGDGRVIRLGGIAWSATAPNAFLNDRLVGVGEYVEGLRVVGIERDRVVLESADGRLEIRLR